MAKPVGWKEDSQDTRWNSLGLLDEHIKSLKRQVEVLAQELRSAVAERDQLLNELGVLQWPGLERDARFLLKLPGSVRKGNSAEWRSDARNGRCESQDGEDGTGEESSCKQVHRRGQSWNGWENKNSKNAQQGKPGGKICRSRIKSFDSALGMDNLPFGGDLPTHRGPAPAFDAVLGATDSSVEGQGSRDPREWGVNTVSNTRILSSISEADDELTSEREDNRDPSVQTPPPDSPSTQTGSDPDGDLELPSEDPLVDPELCEATVQEDPSAPRRWLSNSAFHRNFTDSPVPPAESEDPPEAGFAAHHPHVRMRTTHVALVERANRASRLSKELFQAKFALHDSKSQLHFLTERMKMYKNNFQEEVRRHEEEVQKLKGMLNDATTAKFIMFCKLSECQEKVQQLEENLVVSRAMSGNACSGMDENIDQSNKAAFNQSVLEKVDSARSPPVVQARVRGSSMSTIERGVGKLDQVSFNPRPQLLVCFCLCDHLLVLNILCDSQLNVLDGLLLSAHMATLDYAHNCV